MRKKLYGRPMALLIRIAFILTVIYWLIIRPLRMRNQATRPSEPTQTPPQTPSQVLGVHPDAEWPEIKKAYHQALAGYHPDKVEHLGADIQKVAREKTHEIQAAFEDLKRKKGQ